MANRVLSLSLCGALAAALAIASSPRDVVADHIPGHSNDDPVFPVPIPGQEFFSGGIVFVTAIGPVAGVEIHNTSFDITYVSDGATPASDLHITVGLAINPDDPISVEFVVNGSDLGFGSGPGTFKGTLETDAFNGIPLQGFLPPYSILDISIGAINGGIDGTGYFVDSFINFDVAEDTPGDVDGDGIVGLTDLILVLSVWGPCVDCPADLTGDGVVDFADLLEVLANWS